MTKAPRILVALLVVSLALPAYAQVTDEDIDRARDEVNAVLADSEALGIQVQDAWARQFALDREIGNLETSIELAHVKIAETEARLEEVAVEMYMGSARSASLQVLFSGETEDYGAGVEYLREISGADQDVVSQLRAFRSELDRQTGRLAEASAEQETVTAELERMAEELQGELGRGTGGLRPVWLPSRRPRKRLGDRPRRRRVDERRRRRGTPPPPLLAAVRAAEAPRRPWVAKTPGPRRRRHHHRHRAGEPARWPERSPSATPTVPHDQGGGPIVGWT